MDDYYDHPLLLFLMMVEFDDVVLTPPPSRERTRCLERQRSNSISMHKGAGLLVVELGGRGAKQSKVQRKVRVKFGRPAAPKWIWY